MACRRGAYKEELHLFILVSQHYSDQIVSVIYFDLLYGRQLPHFIGTIYITTFEKKHVVLSMHNISGYVMAILRNIKFILYEKKLKSPKIRKAI